MKSPNLQSSVREWLAFRPGLSRIFSKHGVDLCQVADQSLADACLARRLDSQLVLRVLATAARPGRCELGADWPTAPLAELLVHIETVHHAFYERELPRLADLVAKVAAIYAAAHPEVRNLEQAFRNFRRHFERHLSREKQELFSAIRQLDCAEPQAASVSSIAHLITSLEQDHEAANSELNRIRELTHGFVAPTDACQTYHAMLDGLWELEMNLHQNVYEEDEFLFPRAIRREAMTCGPHGKS
jgi:regulator of cell morphogenesis and NO signaling